jgi:hypothetical protein
MEPFAFQTRIQLLNDCRNFIAGRGISASLKRFFPTITPDSAEAKTFCNNYIESCRKEDEENIAKVAAYKADRANCPRHNLNSSIYKPITEQTVIQTCSGCDYGKLTTTITEDDNYLAERQAAVEAKTAAVAAARRDRDNCPKHTTKPKPNLPLLAYIPFGMRPFCAGCDYGKLQTTIDADKAVDDAYINELKNRNMARMMPGPTGATEGATEGTA